MKHLLKYAAIYSAGAVMAFLGIAILLFQTTPTFASAPNGLVASIATTSNPTVGTTALLLFSTSTCDARIITTYASPIMLTFSQNQGKIPTATFGILQAASTTVAYDSGQYGCGAVTVYSFVSQAITVSESR